MGVAYLAVSDDGGRAVVKTVQFDLADDPMFRRRFRREVLAASAVESTFAPRVLASDLAAERQWMAIEYVEGPTLAELVAANGPLDADQQSALAIALAAGLVDLHQNDLIHRDVKPSNIICTPDGPKLIDFGISVFAHQSGVTTTGDLAPGSPGWMAPEQLDPYSVLTPAVDVFAWACVVWFATTGASPMAAADVPRMIQRLRNWQADPLVVPRDLSNRLSLVVLEALSASPEQRPTSRKLVERLTNSGLPEAPTLVARTWHLPDQVATTVAANLVARETSGTRNAGRRPGLIVLGLAVAIMAMIVAVAFTMNPWGWGRGESGSASADASADTAARVDDDPSVASRDEDSDERDNRTIRDFDFGNATWQTIPLAGGSDGVRVDLRDGARRLGQGFDRIHYTLEDQPVYSDADDDGYDDALVGLRTEQGNGTLVTYNIWRWDPEEGEPVQIHDPVALTSGCGDYVESVRAAEVGFEINEMRVGPGGLEHCAAGRDTAVQRSVGLDGEYPVELAPSSGYGGVCPMTPPTDASPAVNAELHVAPSADSPSVDPPAGSLLASLEPTVGMAPDGWELVWFGPRGGDPDGRVHGPCAWVQSH